MIREVTFYQAVCDTRGCAHDDGEYTAWSDRDGAIETAVSSGWENYVGDHLRCADCRSAAANAKAKEAIR